MKSWFTIEISFVSVASNFKLLLSRLAHVQALVIDG